MPEVLRFGDIRNEELSRLLAGYNLKTIQNPDGHPIPGSFWGDEEAGLLTNRLHVRKDTPVHSALHEACHYICMDNSRRQSLDTNAGGSHTEENAVCYLQILLADKLSWMGRERMFIDMDTWGYTFRLGSAKAWFEQDAQDACAWLLEKNLITQNLQPCWSLRKD